LQGKREFRYTAAYPPTGFQGADPMNRKTVLGLALVPFLAAMIANISFSQC
jgi:hypothetical protein